VIERACACAPVGAERAGFGHAAQAVYVQRRVTNKKTGKVVEGARLYITSLGHEAGRGGAMRMAGLSRGHWTVENNIHWLKDAVMREDACRNRDANTACALALLRTALLAPVRASGRPDFTAALEDCAANKALAVALVTNQRLA
jgi:predicted transposase YbfD/YdcC